MSADAEPGEARDAAGEAVDKTLFQLSYPLLLNAGIGMIVTLIDTILISSYSANAAAAVSLANQILLVAYDLSVLFAVGGVALISRALGRGDADAARSIALTTVAANFVLSLVLGSALLLAGRTLAAWINTPAEIFEDTVLYLQIASATIVFNGVMMAGTATLRGFGRTRMLLFLGIFAYALYLLAASLLIFGFGPFPELGVAGSAIATLIVRVQGMFVLLFVLWRSLGVRIRDWLEGAQLKQTLKDLLEISFPTTADNLAYGVYQMFLVSFIARFDVAMVLARSFTLALSSFLIVVLMAISQANEVMVGYRFGAGRKKSVFAAAFRASWVATLLTTGLAVALYLSADPLLGLFTDDPVVLAEASRLLWLTIFVQPLSAVNTVLFHSLKTMGDVRVPVIATQLMMWGISLPLAWWLCVDRQLGVIGLWYVLIFEEALKAVVIAWRFLRFFNPDERSLFEPPVSS